MKKRVLCLLLAFCVLFAALPMTAWAEEDGGEGTPPVVIPPIQHPNPPTPVVPSPSPTPDPDPTPDESFTDVPADAYYAEAVAWAIEEGIVAGTGDGTTFSPEVTCTRAQIVTFLWRAASSPESTGDVSFGDVPADEYYTDAVKWAVENEITSGAAGGGFDPDGKCTRAQAVTFMWRAAGSPEPEGNTAFPDVPEGEYYADAVQWALENEITVGAEGGGFDPDGECTRAQIVSFLYRNK